jgi:hypothetical protein
VFQESVSDYQQREQGEEAGSKETAGADLQIIKVGTDNSVVDAQNKTGAVITANPQVRNASRGVRLPARLVLGPMPLAAGECEPFVGGTGRQNRLRLWEAEAQE